MNKSTSNIIGIILLFLGISCSQQKDSFHKMPEGTVAEKLSFIENKENFSSESQRLQSLFDVYAESQKEASPVMATFSGKSGYDHLWNDVSPEGVKKNLTTLKMFFEAKEWFDIKDLTDEDIVNLNIFTTSVDDQYNLKSQFPEQYLIIDQIQGIHQAIPSVIQMMPAKSKDEIENLIARMEGVPELLDRAQLTLAEGIEKGIVMPRNTVVQVPNQLKQLTTDNPEGSVFYASFTNPKEGINLEEWETIQKDVREIIIKKVNPALVKFTNFMEWEYLPNSRESVGLKDLPNGGAWYSERIRYYTSTSLTAQEIHELGLSEVERINREMETIKSDLDFNGDLNDFNNFLRQDPQFYFDTSEELLSAYRDICKQIDPMLPTLFKVLPRLPYGVKKIPSYAETASPTAYYQPGSLEAGVPGYFFANTYILKSRPKWEMEALSIHEAVPGHHLQFAISQELKNIPEFRSMLNFTAFIEGWGLYSESLGPDLGMYKDPYSKYGQLTYEMWRAIRLVVDTGIHAFGWSKQEAIDYFKSNSGKSENDIAVEIDRYIAWPGQALAYKIGELKIKELRTKSETALAEKFDIRTFHDVVLGSGSLPLDVLEDNVENWIKVQTAKEE